MIKVGMKVKMTSKYHLSEKYGLRAGDVTKIIGIDPGGLAMLEDDLTNSDGGGWFEGYYEILPMAPIKYRDLL